MSFLTGVRKQKQAWDTTKAPKQPAAKPDLLARERVSSYGGTQAAELQDGYASYAAVYRSYTWVRRAIDVTANNIVSLPVRVVDASDKPLDKHPVSLLLARGNDQMTPATIWQHWLTNMYLGGEGPLEIVDDLRGNPLWLWPRRPDLVMVCADATPERANYPTVAGYVVMPEQAPGATTAPIDVPAGNMIFDKFINPLNTWRGLAPITALRASIIIDVFAQAWAKTFLQRGARPDYALVAPQGITHTEKERILSELMFNYSGADNWHKPIVLEEGITDIKTFSFPPSDMEWVEQRQFTQNEVGALFGVPDEIMGYGKDTYENFQTALQVFWTLTLRPLCEHRDQALTHHFSTRRPLLAPGERVATDFTGVGVLQEDKVPKVDMAVKLWQIGVPFNQLDEQLGLGIGPIDGGEFPNGTDPAIAQAMAELAAQGAQDGQDGVQDDGDGVDTENAQDDEQEAQQGGKTALPFRLSGMAIPDVYKALQLLHDPGDENTPEEVLLRALEDSAQRDIARELRRIYRDLLPPNAESMSLYELQAYIEQRIGSQALNDAIDATVRRAADAGVTIAADQLSSMGVGFDYTMVHTAARDWARAYSAELIRGVNDTTKAAVRESVARWYDNGEHLDALTKDLAPTFGKQRARLIAMTETTRSAAEGTKAGYEASGVVTAMIWEVANDERVCPYCGSLDGKTVDLKGKFSDILSPELQAKLKGRTFAIPPAHPGCILPGNEVVIPGSLNAAAKSFYGGLCVEVTLENGRKITVTKNHPILTPRGWIQAQFLSEGDYVIGTSQAERIATSIKPDYEHTPTAIDKVFSALKKSGAVSTVSVPSSPEDFHGEGRDIHGNVDIVFADGFMLRDGQSAISQYVGESSFNYGAVAEVVFSGGGLSHSQVDALGFTTNGSMSVCSHCDSLLSSGLMPAGNHSLAAIAWRDTMLEQALTEGRATHTSLSREFLLRFAADVSTDKVVNIRTFDYLGHVYDLQSDDYELYICNGVLVKNCRCRIGAQIIEVPNA